MARKAQKNGSLPGSLDMLILRTLSRSLYPALQHLELNGWIDGVWGLTPNNRKAQIYRITASGRRQLAVETKKYA